MLKNEAASVAMMAGAAAPSARRPDPVHGTQAAVTEMRPPISILLNAILASAFVSAPSAEAGPKRHAEPCVGPTVTTGTSDISDRAHAWYQATEHADGSKELCVLVVWRGSPGWFINRESAIRGLLQRGLIDTARTLSLHSDGPGHYARGSTTWEFLGDLELTAEFDPVSRTLLVLGREVRLGQDNIVLIDHADGIGGTATVLRTLHVDGSLDSLSHPVAEVMPRSAELRAFSK